MNEFTGKLLKSSMTSYYADPDQAPTIAECLVRFRGEGQTLSVIYTEGNGGEAHYTGQDRGGGHYAVECPQYKGRGTLHLWHEPGGDITLEGWWWQDGAEGMWRIAVGEGEPEQAV